MCSYNASLTKWVGIKAPLDTVAACACSDWLFASHRSAAVVSVAVVCPLATSSFARGASSVSHLTLIPVGGRSELSTCAFQRALGCDSIIAGNLGAWQVHQGVGDQGNDRASYSLTRALHSLQNLPHRSATTSVQDGVEAVPESKTIPRLPSTMSAAALRPTIVPLRYSQNV